MATTNARIQSPSGIATTRLFMAALSGTGTPNAAGYLAAGEYGGWYSYTNITEPLVGLFFYQVQNSTNQVLANGMINLADDTDTYFGFDPPNSLYGSFQFLQRLDGFISSRMASYTQPTGFLAATFPATVASTTNITTVGAVSGAVGSVTGLTASNLDATISSRATPAQVTTQLTAQGLTSTRAGYLDNLDATVSSRLSETNSAARQVTNIAEHDATQATLAALNVSSQVQSAMTSQGYTTSRAPLLDNLDAAVSSRESESSASTRATTDQTEHDATQSAIAGLGVGAAVTAALTAQGLTSTRAGYLDNLDATVSSRQSESSASTRATTNQTEHDATQATLASLSVTVDNAAIATAVWNALTAASVTSGSFGKLVKDYLDAAVTSRAVASDVTAGLTSQGYTGTRAGKLDNLDNLDAAVTTRATPAQVTTQLTAQGLTSTRAGYLDNLDAAVTSRATPAQVTTALTDQGLTTGRADKLDNLDATVASRATPANVTTQLTAQGLTTTRAAYLDNIAAAPPTLVAISADLTPKIVLASDQATIAATNTQPEP